MPSHVYPDGLDGSGVEAKVLPRSALACLACAKQASRLVDRLDRYERRRLRRTTSTVRSIWFARRGSRLTKAPVITEANAFISS